MFILPPAHLIATQVAAALSEDIGSTDHTANLIPVERLSRARVITRDAMVFCGRAWFDEVFRQVDPRCRVEWVAAEGRFVSPNEELCYVDGPARALLTAERTALNFLQMLSGTATTTREWVRAVAGTHAQIMDTRKTLPGLRLAQKYAVTVGGGYNQRLGLYDGVLIKENHITAAGSIAAVLELARQTTPSGVPIQIEVENLAQLEEALAAEATLILLDNFCVEALEEAVRITAGRAWLEASGNVTLETVAEIAATGVDRISVGALTKHVHAIDLSMRFLS